MPSISEPYGSRSHSGLLPSLPRDVKFGSLPCDRIGVPMLGRLRVGLVYPLTVISANYAMHIFFVTGRVTRWMISSAR